MPGPFRLCGVMGGEGVVMIDEFDPNGVKFPVRRELYWSFTKLLPKDFSE